MSGHEQQGKPMNTVYMYIYIEQSKFPSHWVPKVPHSSWQTHLPWSHGVPQTPYPRLQGMLPTLEPPLNQSELQAPARASRPHFQGRTGDVLSTGHPPKRGKPMACGTLWILEMFEVRFFGVITMHEIKTSCCLTSDCPSPFLHAPNFASPDVPLWTSLRTPGTDSTYGPKDLDGSKWSKPFKNYYNSYVYIYNICFIVYILYIYVYMQSFGVDEHQSQLFWCSTDQVFIDSQAR